MVLWSPAGRISWRLSKQRTILLVAVNVLLVLLIFTRSAFTIDKRESISQFSRLKNAAVSGGKELEEQLDQQDLATRVPTDEELQAHPRPLELLRHCDNEEERYEGQSNMLVSRSGPEQTMLRMDFGFESNKKFDRYNPNVLPFPAGYKHQYFGLARQTKKGPLFLHHELVFCEMEWGHIKVTNRKILKCVGKGNAVQLKLPQWDSKKGSCNPDFLEIAQGQLDPRLFFSPSGEPLMIVGTNGKSNCLSQFIIDLRAVIPDLNEKMKLEHLPIKYTELTELPRNDLHPIEKNYFIFYDAENKPLVHHEFKPRSMTTLDSEFTGRNLLRIDKQTPPACITNLLKKFSDKRFKTLLHQSSNALRVTLCEFPCVPTIHNTVEAAIIHVKYSFDMVPYYKRYMVFMNLTSPYEIVGVSSSLMYAGSDERDMLFTVSMAWDKHFQKRREWEDASDLPAGYVPWSASLTAATYSQMQVSPEALAAAGLADPNAPIVPAVVPAAAPVAPVTDGGFMPMAQGMPAEAAKAPSNFRLRKRQAPAAGFDAPAPVAQAPVAAAPVAPAPVAPAPVAPAAVPAGAAPDIAAIAAGTGPDLTRQGKEITLADEANHETIDEPPAPPEPEHIAKKSKNPLISEYHHGWIDDMLLINIGIRDFDSAIMHVRMRDVVECMQVCSR
ncbi:hypothetical protein BZA70DRAFT_291712 [Myxozyma melibiosi]|uniref:Uncharacterized protein n=1 Tax=Myxozyma melibiosi TaxID=54550 RepID=A0ABR1F192_9ASCO